MKRILSLVGLLSLLAVPAWAATQDVTITITPSPVNVSSVTGWIIEKKVAPATTYTAMTPNLPASTLTATDANVPAGATICYRATPTSSLGNGTPSADACINSAGVPGAPTVSVTITIH